MTAHKIFQNKLLVTVSVLLLLVGFIVLAARTNKPLSPPQPNQQTFEKIQTLDKEAAKNDVTIIESNKIYDIGDDQPVITAIINDPKPLIGKYPFLKKAYKGDVIITTPQQTVIFDPSTKTVRDIGKISLYEELSN
ncbi:MAG: hypothetical protein Q7T74_01760 [Candidatus Saccharibacteria bacterium]|nr:hypothetical protein [Candidatus Saccharibacteria bacterium]